MKPLKLIQLGSDSSLFAINAIVERMAFFYMEVTLHTPGRSQKVVKLPVRMDPNVPRESYLSGVSYKSFIPVLVCYPISDEEFYTEVGYVAVNSLYLDMNYQKRSYLTYAGYLPDVAQSDARDKRFVAPLITHQVDTSHIQRPGRFKPVKVFGATLHTNYLRTSALDSIDDETWEALWNVGSTRGITWSRFLDDATNGRFTPHDDLSDCFEALDHEYMPEHIFKRIRMRQHENRMRK